MSLLHTPIAIGNTTFKNRIFISPMCQYSAREGVANNWHLVHLGARAIGGAGLVMQEATAVSAEGRITYGDLGIYNDIQVDRYAEIVAFIHSQGAKAGIQLAHAGRKASCEVPWNGGAQIAPDRNNGWKTLGASAIPFLPDYEPPTPLDTAGIQNVVDDFVAATKRAIRAGYDVIEIHGAHGYLLNQFYSPLSNQRTDDYGGSFENRVRLLLEVTAAVKKEWGERPLFVRVSSTDWTEGGWAIEDTVRLSALLEQKGVHVIDASSGGIAAHPAIPSTPGYQVGFAEAIKKGTSVLTAAVGLITTAQQAEEILQRGEADIIFIARESLRNPNFGLDSAAALGDDVEWPAQYLRAKTR